MKISISLTRKPRLRRPVLICIWPGMGEVAFKIGVYLRDKLKMEEFAVLSAPELFPPTGVWIENNLLQLPKPGVGKLYFYKNKASSNDIVLFLSDAQPLLEHAYEYCKKILTLAKELKIKSLFTFAAMPQAIDHIAQPQVWFGATDKKTADQINSLHLNIKPLASGQVSGLNGLMLGAGQSLGFEGVCLLGEIPLFTIQIENPKASLAILNKLVKIIKVEVDTSGLQEQVKSVEQEIEKLINFIHSPDQQHLPAQSPIGEDEIEKIKKSLSLYTKLPQSAREKIDKLFFEVKSNIAKAAELKKELDHWNVYKEYEDKFLDLFNSKKDKEDKKHN